jgi:hypothetical protein
MDSQFQWGWGNEVLYRMCRDEPHHTNHDVIAGKIWLIGRAYAAAIERGAGGAIIEGQDFHQTIAPKIAESRLDKWLESVADVKHVDEGNRKRVLEVHQRFNTLLKNITGLERRSFASKYLHFYNPSAFFIFDSRACREINRKFRRQRFVIPKDCEEVDKSYAGFVLRCIAYRDSELDGRTRMTPRQLDQHLLGY